MGDEQLTDALVKAVGRAGAAARLLPAPAFQRFWGRFYPNFPQGVRHLAYHAFIEGACAFAERVAEIYEREPATEEQRAFAREIRQMVEKADRHAEHPEVAKDARLNEPESEVNGVGPELLPPSPASRAAHQQDGPRQLEHEGSRCADCGVLLDWHGSECGMEVDDPRAEEYFPPAGWAAAEVRCVGCGRLPSEGVGCSSCPGYNNQGYREGDDVR